MHIIFGKLIIESDHWNLLAIIVDVVSLLFYYLCVICINSIDFQQDYMPQLTGQFSTILSSNKTWTIIIALPFLALLPDISYKLGKKLFYPTEVDCLMNMQ